jgi:hypothetical protein
MEGGNSLNSLIRVMCNRLDGIQFSCFNCIEILSEELYCKCSRIPCYPASFVSKYSAPVFPKSYARIHARGTERSATKPYVDSWQLRL